jgi:hypothetical protein
MFRLRRFVPTEKAALERWQDSCRMKIPPIEQLELPDPFEEVKGG